MQYQPFWDYMCEELYPTWFLHSFGMNGKISGCVAGIGDVAGKVVSVLHAPKGCAFHYRYSSRRRYYPYYPLLSTDLTEQEIIMGGEAKLEQTVRDAYRRYQPDLIFIIPSPITDILNEDIAGVVLRLKAEGIPVAACKSELFSLPDKDYVKLTTAEHAKLKVGEENHLELEVVGCGFTEAALSFVDQVMEKTPVVENSVNIETISWHLEGGRNLHEMERFLNQCGIVVNSWILSSPLEELKRAPAAKLNLVRFFVRWARHMKDVFGTDYLAFGDTNRYDGLEGIGRFYLDIAERLHKEAEMEHLVSLAIERARKETADDLAYLGKKSIVLSSRSLQAAPAQIKKYTQVYGLHLKAVCITLTDMMRRYYSIDDEILAQLMTRLHDAVALYAPGTEVLVNPDDAALAAALSDVDAVVCSDDFTLEGLGTPVISDIFDSIAYTFPSYVRSVHRLRERMERAHVRRDLILNRMNFSQDDISLYPDESHFAAREMWIRMWLEKNQEHTKTCDHHKKKECCE
jgi:nitrogenase molybdenum-iron protein alpha/beta subunit